MASKRAYSMVYLQNPNNGSWSPTYYMKGKFDLGATNGTAPGTKENAEQLVKDGYVLPRADGKNTWFSFGNGYSGTWRQNCVFGVFPTPKAGDTIHMYNAIITHTDPWQGRVTLSQDKICRITRSPWPQLQGTGVPVDLSQVIPIAVSNGNLSCVGNELHIEGTWNWSFAKSTVTLELK